MGQYPEHLIETIFYDMTGEDPADIPECSIYPQYGDIEEIPRVVTDISGYPGYTASNDGIICGRKGKPLKDRMQHGYVYVQMYNEQHKLCTLSKHRIIATLFVPNPDDMPEVNHKDCVTTHNWSDNLEWTDRGGNTGHAIMYNRYDKDHYTKMAIKSNESRRYRDGR